MKQIENNHFGLLAKKHILKRKQFLLYALIGLSGVLIDYVAYALGIKIFGLGILTANFISVSLGIINNFFLNVKYNFKVKDRLAIRFGLFYAVGFLGLLVSDILLLIFHDGLGIGALLAKLLTLPFILVGQYLLNKYTSFGNVDSSRVAIGRLVRHWPAFAILGVFIFTSLLFVKFIPADFKNIPPARQAAYAPDEMAHYNFNVEFLLNNNRLPVSGKDDLEAYTNCRDNPSAQVPCLYSYTVYPAPSYIFSAVSAKLFSGLTNSTSIVAARFPATLYGSIFILCVYFSAYLIARRRFIATLLTIGVGLIPQFIFTSSYINLDAHSIAISGLLGLALVLFMQNPKNRTRARLLAVVACGLLPLAKYNYFVLFLPVLAIVLWYFKRGYIQKRQLLTIALWGIGSFIVLASFWYVRNAILYQDILGQNFVLNEMSKYHPLGESLGLNAMSLVRLTHMNFFTILFNSFFLTYGGMFYVLDSYKYAIPGIISTLIPVYLVTYAVTNKNLKPLAWACIGFAIVFLLTLGQVIYNSLFYDFQPQGRYMFPILVPLVLLLAFAYRLDKRLAILSVLLASSTLYLFINGFELFVKVYINVF